MFKHFLTTQNLWVTFLLPFTLISRQLQVKKFTILKRIVHFIQCLIHLWLLFIPCLKLEKIFIVQSFNHSFESLIDVGYLSKEILPYFDPIRQLKDCAIAVFNKKERFSLRKMFSCELKFVIELLKKWLAGKFFKRFRELDYFTKQRFKNENPINWSKTNCIFCGFSFVNKFVVFSK